MACAAAGMAARPLHLLIVAPWPLYLVVLALMMFRNPQVELYAIDRIAFVLLIFVVLMRAMLLPQWLTIDSLTWPLLGLVLLGVAGTLANASDPQAWSLFVAKWLVPFALFHISGLVFDDPGALRRLEWFLLAALAYLALTSIASVAGAKMLVFPRYILDDNLGIQAGRARGPFLQSVANGVSLNLLGLVALDSFRRRRLKGVLAMAVLLAVPMAILATLTRAVWLAFAGSVVMTFLLSSSRRLRRACLFLALAGLIGGLFAGFSGTQDTPLENRLEDRGTVEYRVTLYTAGWQMFLERPFLGWGPNRTPFELARRMDGYQQEAFYFHNTYLEILVAYGIVGLGLYGWTIVGLFRLSQRRALSDDDGFLDAGFRSVWPVLVSVYLVNAFFVVMNYQFVNGLLFTLAGILATQNQSGKTNEFTV